MIVASCTVVLWACKLASAGELVTWGWYNNSPSGSDFTSIAAGDQYISLAVRSDGSLVGWGKDIGVPTGNDFVAVAAGMNHGLALKADGSITAWGDNFFRQCNVPSQFDFVAIDAAGNNSYGLTTGGSLIGWGTDYPYSPYSTLGGCVTFSAAEFTVVALTAVPGAIRAWGRFEVTDNIPSGNDFIAVAAGRQHALALKSDGSLVGWGENSLGQCNVPLGNGYVAIAAGAADSLAIKSDGSLVAWGQNNEGQCDVPEGNNFIAIVVGGHHSVALFVDNFAPKAQPAPSHQVVEIGIDPIVVVADVSDFDGDTLLYEWLKNDEILDLGTIATPQGGGSVMLPDLYISAGDTRFPVGVHEIILKVDDGTNEPVTASVSVHVIDTIAPSLSPVPSVTILWSPDHKLHPVTVQANAFDNGGGAITLAVTVSSSEPPDVDGSGNTIPDYHIDSVDSDTGIIELRLRAERSGKGSGRIYTVTIAATDTNGNQSVAELQILAPHSL
jgi:hypothetical protein